MLAILAGIKFWTILRILMEAMAILVTKIWKLKKKYFPKIKATLPAGKNNLKMKKNSLLIQQNSISHI